MSAPAGSHERWSRGPVAVLLATACLLSACGDSGSDQSAERDQIEAVVRSLQGAVATNDGDRVCQTLSKAARIHVRGMGHDPGTSPPCYFDVYMFIDGVRRAPGWRERLRREVTDIAIDGDRATAKVDFGDGQSASLPFAKEEGQWKVDALWGGIPAAQQKDRY